LERTCAYDGNLVERLSDNFKFVVAERRNAGSGITQRSARAGTAIVGFGGGAFKALRFSVSRAQRNKAGAASPT
jgi:hypothetical protein